MDQQQPNQNKLNEKKDLKGDRNPSQKTGSEQRLDEAKAVHDQVYGGGTRKGGINQNKAS